MFNNSACYAMPFCILILVNLRESILFTSKIQPVLGLLSLKELLFSFTQSVDQMVIH